MANTNSLYPQVNTTNPDANSPFTSNSTTSQYPSIDIPISSAEDQPPAAIESAEEVLITIRGSIIHLIDKNQSVELAYGDLHIIRIRQNDADIAVLARIGDQIQWPLAKDEAAVKLDDSHYFFSLRVPGETEGPSENSMLNYGVTIAAKGQEGILQEFDRILGQYSNFSVQEVVGENIEGWWMAKDTAPWELEGDTRRKEMVEENSAAYWTTLAPNVEDYSGSVARLIATGSGKLIQGILWCGDVTVDRLRWGNDYLKKRMGKKDYSDVSPEAFNRIERVKKMTMMSEKVAAGILSGVVRVTGCVAGSIANSKLGQKFFNMLPGEIILASLDGYDKICDAIEVAGRNVMSTTSTVTTELVSDRYGDKAAKATNVGLDAAGHAIGTAWAVFKITKALNPKSAIKPSKFVKAAAHASKSKKQT